MLFRVTRSMKLAVSCGIIPAGAAETKNIEESSCASGLCVCRRNCRAMSRASLDARGRHHRAAEQRACLLGGGVVGGLVIVAPSSGLALILELYWPAKMVISALLRGYLGDARLFLRRESIIWRGRAIAAPRHAAGRIFTAARPSRTEKRGIELKLISRNNRRMPTAIVLSGLRSEYNTWRRRCSAACSSS